jgi:hypothetical protein
MKKILTATLAVAIALAPASAFAQGAITGQQSYVTGTKPEAAPGKYKVVKVKKAKAVHRKHRVAKAAPGQYQPAKVRNAKAIHRNHAYKVAKASHYQSYYRLGHYPHHWHRHSPHWLLPALVGTAVGLGLFRYWH